MTIRLYIDEDSMHHALTRALRARGLDVFTALEADKIECSDDEHLQFAASQQRALFSFNVRDFYALHANWLTANRTHFGIILARQQVYSVGELMRRILRLSAARSTAQLQNTIEFLSMWG